MVLFQFLFPEEMLPTKCWPQLWETILPLVCKEIYNFEKILQQFEVACNRCRMGAE